MSFSLDPQETRHRCNALARQIADHLATRQCTSGQFEKPDFYGKAFAVNLWRRIDPVRFGSNIDRALGALRSEQHDQTYHREFIEYALLDTPGMPPETIVEVLRGAKPQCPDVANWQMLGLINRQKRTSGRLARLINFAHFSFIKHRYWRPPFFMDRPDYFSAQYHAFCTALLIDSGHKRHQRIADKATETIAQLASPHGHANLLGRGAGQSFGAACALYALLKKGYLDTATAVLYRIEDAFFRAGQLPLNLLAPMALPADPGPDNPQTPGWYSYNRYDDYLAFAGYWLMKASQIPAKQAHRSPASSMQNTSNIVAFSSPLYHAQMTLSGRQSFDFLGVPVIVSGQGKSARILLPPTGGEQDAPSLYGPAAIPLPAIAENHFARFHNARQVANNRIDVTFDIDGVPGHRNIAFHATCVTITDHVPDHDAGQIDLFRILIDGNIALTQNSPHTITCDNLGIKITANAPLQMIANAAFSAAGPATRIAAIATPGNNATLTITWDDGNA